MHRALHRIMKQMKAHALSRPRVITMVGGRKDPEPLPCEAGRGILLLQLKRKSHANRRRKISVPLPNRPRLFELGLERSDASGRKWHAPILCALRSPNDQLAFSPEHIHGP